MVQNNRKLGAQADQPAKQAAGASDPHEESGWTGGAKGNPPAPPPQQTQARPEQPNQAAAAPAAAASGGPAAAAGGQAAAAAAAAAGDQAGQADGTFAPDIEEEANSYFQKIYTAQQSIDDIISMLQVRHHRRDDM